MKVSYAWLNEYFESKLPDADTLANALTMHAVEIDSIEAIDADIIIDAKTTPNLNHFCLCHRGIAREAGVILNMQPKKYSRDFIDFKISETAKKISVEINDPKLCRRYVARVIENVKVGESPAWLKTKLETLGQRSINNIVDATNFVMLEIGQPTHVFDADKISSEIVVQHAHAGQKITTLDRKEISLDETTLLITDGEHPLAIAGIKGGDYAELTNETRNIILESANFHPTLIRKTAQKIRIQTDASKRFENEITPELADEAMDVLTRLIVEIAGTSKTKTGEAIDVYPRKASPFVLGISANEASDILGVHISDPDIVSIFDRFGFAYKKIKPIDAVLRSAPTFVGIPYKNGASISYDAPNLFDCSSFTSFLFAHGGIQIPRMSIDQYVFGTPIGRDDLQPGDMIFSNTGETKRKTDYASIEFLPHTSVPGGVDHCGIYLGEGNIIHCTESLGGVIIETIATAERFKNIVGYRRMADNRERFVVTIPAERLDLRLKEDLAEEIGRIYGYEKIPDSALAKIPTPKADNAFAYKEKIRRILYAEGFSEVINYTFAEKGDIELANPMSQEKKFLRTNLSNGLDDCLVFNARHADLVDMPQIRIFEFGHVFTNIDEREHFAFGLQTPGIKKLVDKKDCETVARILSEKLGIGLKKINREDTIAEFDYMDMLAELPELNDYDFSEIGESHRKFKAISPYPYIVRDIAVFTPEGTTSEEVFRIITQEAGNLMVKGKLFDTFTKIFSDGSKKISYAYRLIFQSYERTLSDDEVNSIMARMTERLNTAGAHWQVR